MLVNTNIKIIIILFYLTKLVLYCIVFQAEKGVIIMTREEFRKLPKEDKKIINTATNLVTKFMTDDDEDRNEYKMRLLSLINKVICSSTNFEGFQREFGRYNFAGACLPIPKYKKRLKPLYKFLRIFPKNLKFKVDVAIDDINRKHYYETLLTAVHEVHHVDTFLYSKVEHNAHYNGAMITVPTKNGSKTYGTAFNESLNELYEQIVLLQTCPEVFKNIHSLKDLIYRFRFPEFNYNLSMPGYNYRILILITKLLIMVSDNDLDTSYESLQNDGKKFIEKTIDLNGTKVFKNDLLYAGKKDMKSYGEQFDKVCGEGSFLKILRIYEYIYDCLAHAKRTNKNAFLDIIELIDKYKDAKYDLMVKNGYWSEIKRLNADYRYKKYRSYLYSNFQLYKLVEERKKAKTLKNKTGN